MRKIRKIPRVALLAGALLLFTGCGKEALADTTTISVQKNGTVGSVVVENFEKEYYSEEELKGQVEADVAAFNKANGADSITFEKLQVKEGIAALEMTYQNAQAYVDFNGEEFFCGTVAKAYEADYSLDVTLKNASDETQTIDKSGILENGEMHLVITAEPVLIKTYSNILYFSGNVTLINNKEASVLPKDGQLAYILFK